MKLTDWLAVAPTVQNGWTLTALIAMLLYLYFPDVGQVKFEPSTLLGTGREPNKKYGHAARVGAALVG